MVTMNGNQPQLDLRSGEPDPYLEVARRFFNEFLQLKIELDRQGAVTQKVQQKERERYERDLKKWKDANEALKGAAANLVAENERLEGQVLSLTSERDNLQRKLNEERMHSNETARKLREYPLDQHMSEAAFREWQKIMQSIPLGVGSH